MLIERSRELFRNFDWWLLAIVLVLLAISLSAIYSVDLSRGEALNFFSTQFLAIILGLVLFFVASLMNVSFYRSLAFPLYLLAVLFLIGVLFFGQTVRGTTGWFRFAGFSFQPVELAKVGLVLFLASWIERYGRRFEKLQFVVSTGLLTILPIVFIILQPDLGSSLVLAGVWFVLLLFTGIKKKYLFILIGSIVVLFLCSWFFFFADYQKERIVNFFNPERDPLGVGYNVNQSIIAIGSGKIFGRGLGFGSQSQLHFLPEAQTDFIFSVIAEELGFFGAGLVLCFYFLLCWRLLFIAKNANDDFSAYLVLGVCALFFIHLFVNLGATMGFMPVIGVTLPFLSYGGSSILIDLLFLGIVESVVKSEHRLL